MSQNEETKMVAKLSRFGFGFELDGFVTFLSWNGMVMSTVSAIICMALFAIPNDMRGLHLHSHYNLDVLGYILYPCGAIGLVLAMIVFGLNFKLRKDQDKMASLKRICYLKSGLSIFMLCCNIVVIFVTVFLGGVSYLLQILFSAIPLIFYILLVHGIRTQRRNFIKSFLIFAYVYVGIVLLLGLGSGAYFSFTFMGVIFFATMLCSLIYVYIFVSNIGYIIALDSLILNNSSTFKEFTNPQKA